MRIQNLQGQEQYEKYLGSARFCPVLIIEINDLDTGEKLFPKS